MKVNIYETVQVSDQQRIDIARSLDGDGAKKRQATRDEIKSFIWGHGSDWAEHLASAPEGEPDTEEPDADEEDLLG